MTLRQILKKNKYWYRDNTYLINLGKYISEYHKTKGIEVKRVKEKIGFKSCLVNDYENIGLVVFLIKKYDQSLKLKKQKQENKPQIKPKTKIQKVVKKEIEPKNIERTIYKKTVLRKRKPKKQA